MLKPAVRAETDANTAASRRSTNGRAPSVPGLPHSKTRIASAPAGISTAVAVSVSLVCSDQWRGSRNRARRSISTGKPMPPITMPSMIGTSVQASEP